MDTLTNEEWILRWDGHKTPEGVVCLAWLDGDDVAFQFDKTINGKMHIYNTKFNPNAFAKQCDADAAIIDLHKHFVNLTNVK